MSTGSRPDVWQTADLLQQTLRTAEAQLVELRSLLAALPIPPAGPRCPLCGYRSATNLPSVREHLETVHGLDGDVLEEASTAPAC